MTLLKASVARKTPNISVEMVWQGQQVGYPGSMLPLPPWE